jgi:hypothetical protein
VTVLQSCRRFVFIKFFAPFGFRTVKLFLPGLIAEPPLELEDRESLIRNQFLIAFGRGLKLFRAQALSWRWKPAPLTERGMVKDEPVKANDDCNDCTRMVTAGWGPDVEPMTREE